MKTTATAVTKAFTPITLELKIETEEELRVFRALWGVSNSIGDVMVQRSLRMGNITGMQAGEILTEAFLPLEDLAGRLNN